MTSEHVSCPIDISIVIVSWNVADLLHTCLQTILASPLNFNTQQTDNDRSSAPSAEIIVVDSASSDHTISMLTEFPQVTLLAQKENVGFAKGNNIGFSIARGRYLFMLNPDTEIIGDVIVEMFAYLDENPSVGILGPQTLNSDQTYQSTKRRFYDRKTAFFESTWLQPYAPQSWLDHFYAEDVARDQIADVDWVQGSALLARREIYDTIGGLDENYVMYSEETDWCKRAKTQGWRVVYWGAGSIIHHGGKSSEQAGALKHIHFQTSKIRYFRKHDGRMMSLMLRLFLLSNYALQYMVEAAKFLLGHKRDLRRHRMNIYYQVLKSGLR